MSIKFRCVSPAWQEGYGVFSLGGKQLQEAIDYVHNQKIHHLHGTTIALLEQETDLEKPPQPPTKSENKLPKISQKPIKPN